MSQDDGTCHDPMWSEKDQMIGWVMCGVGSLILILGWAACLVALWSKK